MPTPHAALTEQPDFEAIRSVLLRCVRQACPSYLRNSAEDIAQSALTRIVTKMNAEAQPLALNSSYLWKVANHAVIDEIRYRQRRPEASTDASDQAVGAAGDPDRAEHDRRIREGVRDCLRGANEDRRAALGLYLQGLSLAEVTLALGLERKRTENLIYRGLNALRKCLATKGLKP